jgi:UDP-N-acetylglucosamine 2-epimerase (non-hydrolysing)
MKKIFVVIGTRPEAIKMAPIIDAIRNSDRFDVVVCITGQHRELLEPMLEFFRIVPNFDLGILEKNICLTELTAKILQKLSPVVASVKPDLILVQGDTTSAYVGAVAGFYQKVKIGHVEAGLRTYDITSPWPEEMNRRLITQLSDFHFCPTEKAMENLLREGVTKDSIFVTGNTVVDALKDTLGRLANKQGLVRRCLKRISLAGYDLNLDGSEEVNKNMGDCLSGKDSLIRPFILITGHRRENFDDGLNTICESVKELANKYMNFDFVYPVHLNPSVQKSVKSILSGLNNVFLLRPLIYPDFVMLMNNCKLILTDSGGIQEEAPTLGKLVLVMRDNTERSEAVDAGGSKLIGSSIDEGLVDEVSCLIDDDALFLSMQNKIETHNFHNLFGRGDSARILCEIFDRVII